MFLKSLYGSVLGLTEVEFAQGGKPEYPEQKSLGVKLRLTNLSPLAEPKTRSRIVEVGGLQFNFTPL